MTKRLLLLLLVFCLLTGCGKTTAPDSSSTPESADLPPQSVSQPEAESAPEEPDNLAGAELYYYGGHRLILYGMEPGTGEIRVVREKDFWNGREVESISPSGNRVLLSSWDGAPSPEVEALSVYDIEKDRLVNLSRTIEDHYGSWEEAHWFPYKWSNGYCFVDENTILYQAICDRETPGKNHLHLYDIGGDGTVTARFLELEAPGDGQEDWGGGCIWYPEGNAVLGHLLEKNGPDWVTWDVKTGKLLSRRPGRNGDIPIGACPYRIRDGVIYYTEDDWDLEICQLMAYEIAADTMTVIASGPLVLTGEAVQPGEEKDRGYFEDTWLEGIREDGSFVIRSVMEHRGNRTQPTYREAAWNPAAGGEIRLGEIQAAPAFPVDDDRGYTPCFAAAPDGSGLYLPLPEEMVPEESYGSPPYLVSYRSTGEILFLAK